MRQWIGPALIQITTELWSVTNDSWNTKNSLTDILYLWYHLIIVFRYLKTLVWSMSLCYVIWPSRLCFYQTTSAWSMDQGSTRKGSVVHNFAPTVTNFCVMWEGLSLPHDTKFGKCRGEIVDRRMIFIWPLIHGSGWSGLIKAEPEQTSVKL